MPRGKKNKGSGFSTQSRRKKYNRPPLDPFERFLGTYATLTSDPLTTIKSDSIQFEDCKTSASAFNHSVQTVNCRGDGEHIQLEDCESSEKSSASVCNQSVQTVNFAGDGDHIYARYSEGSINVDKSCNEHIEIDCDHASMDSSANIDVGFAEETVKTVSFQSFIEDVKKCVLNRNYVFRQSGTEILTQRANSCRFLPGGGKIGKMVGLSPFAREA